MKIGEEEIEQVSSFRYLGTNIREDMRCTQEIKIRIALGKEAFNQRKQLLCSKLDKDLRKKLARCFVWNVALYGAETWTMKREDEKRLEAFEMWVWRRMERISWMDRVTNEEVLDRVQEKRKLLETIKKEKGNGWAIGSGEITLWSMRWRVW